MPSDMSFSSPQFSGIVGISSLDDFCEVHANHRVMRLDLWPQTRTRPCPKQRRGGSTRETAWRPTAVTEIRGKFCDISHYLKSYLRLCATDANLSMKHPNQDSVSP